MTKIDPVFEVNLILFIGGLSPTLKENLDSVWRKFVLTGTFLDK